MSNNKSVLFIVPYPRNQVASQRFRFEQYENLLKIKGFVIEFSPFLSEAAIRVVYRPNQLLKKILYVIAGILGRIVLLFRVPRFDFVFIHREAAPMGPPLIEWFIAKILRKKIIYDFDDAIWLTDKVHGTTLERTIRWRSKVASICKWSYKISCGNEYLLNYAKQFNTRSVINPTTIDTEHLHNPKLYEPTTKSTSLTIGWTGSHSTLKYLNQIEATLQILEQKHHTVNFLIIADRLPDLNLSRTEFIPWRKETEVADLLTIDIGIMPLPDNEWAKGKCGFKALQYMAVGIPCVASPIGVNTSIIDHEITGFHASTNTDWIHYLGKLIKDGALRKKLGDAGRKKVIELYSVNSNTSNFLSLLE